MTTRFATPMNEARQFSDQIAASQNYLSQKLELLEMNLSKLDISKSTSPEIQNYFIDAKNMLKFARSNLEKGFYNVSDASLVLANIYLQKMQAFPKR